MGYRCDKCGKDVPMNRPTRILVYCSEIKKLPGLQMLTEAGLCDGCIKKLDNILERVLSNENDEW